MMLLFLVLVAVCLAQPTVTAIQTQVENAAVFQAGFIAWAADEAPTPSTLAFTVQPTTGRNKVTFGVSLTFGTDPDQAAQDALKAAIIAYVADTVDIMATAVYCDFETLDAMVIPATISIVAAPNVGRVNELLLATFILENLGSLFEVRTPTAETLDFTVGIPVVSNGINVTLDYTSTAAATLDTAAITSSQNAVRDWVIELQIQPDPTKIFVTYTQRGATMVYDVRLVVSALVLPAAAPNPNATAIKALTDNVPKQANITNLLSLYDPEGTATAYAPATVTGASVEWRITLTYTPATLSAFQQASLGANYALAIASELNLDPASITVSFSSFKRAAQSTYTATVGIQGTPPPAQPEPQPQPGPQPQPEPQPGPQPGPQPAQPEPQPGPQPGPQPAQPEPQPGPQPGPQPAQPEPQPGPQPGPQPAQPEPQPGPQPAQPQPQPQPAQPQPQPQPAQPQPQPAQPQPQPAQPQPQPAQPQPQPAQPQPQPAQPQPQPAQPQPQPAQPQPQPAQPQPQPQPAPPVPVPAPSVNGPTIDDVINTITSPAVQEKLNDVAREIVPPATIGSFGTPTSEGTTAKLTIAVSFDRELTAEEQTNAEAAVKAALIESLGIADASTITVQFTIVVLKRGIQVSYTALVTIQANEVPAPTAEQLVAAMSNTEVQGVIRDDITGLTPSGAAAFGIPVGETNSASWIVTVDYTVSLTDTQATEHGNAIKQIIADALGTPVEKFLQYSYVLLNDNTKRDALQAQTYQASMTISGAASMIASAALMAVMFLAAFL